MTTTWVLPFHHLLDSLPFPSCVCVSSRNLFPPSKEPRTGIPHLKSIFMLQKRSSSIRHKIQQSNLFFSFSSHFYLLPRLGICNPIDSRLSAHRDIYPSSTTHRRQWRQQRGFSTLSWGALLWTFSWFSP